MNCCVECFRDIHIRDTIEKFGKIGDCDYCSHKGVMVCDISKTPNPISEKIESLLQIYTVSDEPDAKPLKTALHDEWDIFNAGQATIEILVKELCTSVINPNSDIFTKPVAVSQLLDKDFLHECGVVREYSWEQFTESIKHKNRFHSDMFNADAFASFLSMTAKQYSAGTEFYRARIPSDSKDKKLGKDQMGAPPSEKRSAGRINPEGIGVLYLSTDDKTVLHEIHARVFDYVTIGKFKSLQDITIVNLSGISEASPFLYANVPEQYAQYAVNRKIFQEVAKDIAKPLRRNDSILEYLPTQYIAEFIKSQAYDGVGYASTIRESGYNIAIFDETLFECVEVNTIEITDIQYNQIEI